MTTKQLTKEQIRLKIEDKIMAHFGLGIDKASEEQIFQASAIFIRELMSRLSAVNSTKKNSKEVHYLSMEFLMGRSLAKNAYNLGILDALNGAFEDMGHCASDIFEKEPDAGLGNGGLGRLAACYLDSLATLGINATAYSICYELGIFRQLIENGCQKETADAWVSAMDAWLVPNYNDTCEVRFGGRLESYWNAEGKYISELHDYISVLALPRDMLACSYGGTNVNRLRLWEAKSQTSLDMFKFSVGEYIDSLAERTMAEVITKVLYPADDHISGKTLRLKQQYFFVSATAQTLIKKHIEVHGDVKNLAKHHAIQINDTHPSLIIPELMRLLMDEQGLSWDEAWDIVCGTVSYTNHTVMAEALETWTEDLVSELLPRVYEIILEIHRRYTEELMFCFNDDEVKVQRNSIIQNGYIQMALICVCACHKVNGVSKLHGDILVRDIFSEIHELDPNKFTYVTNGIDHRRWLSQINPDLDMLIRELIGDGYLKNPEELSRLLDFEHDKEVLMRLREIKLKNKERFSDYIYKTQGKRIDTKSKIEVHVKRLHEYKRQLMCAMLITELRNRLRDEPDMDFTPRTFVFGAKAAASYYNAKRIIELLCSLSADIENDPACKGKLSLVFLENYRVSVAEKLMPAAEISHQISTAGKEASGTGNMKLMLNGAVTIGTYDGANVEMFELLGDENMSIFGLDADEVKALQKSGYDAKTAVEDDERIERIFRRFSTGFSDGKSYSDLVSSIVDCSDPYMLTADFEAYVDAYDELYDKLEENLEAERLALVNIANSGIFSADRSISDYAEFIWDC